MFRSKAFIGGVGEAQRETERYRRLEEALLEAEIELMKTPGLIRMFLELILSGESVLIAVHSPSRPLRVLSPLPCPRSA